MTTVQRVAQLFGWVFILVAVVGLVQVHTMQPGLLLGIFPVNLLHNIVHLLFGLWGLAAAKSYGAARNYGLVGGVIYLVLALCGYFAPDGFGLVPLGGNDIWLHVVLGAALLGAALTAKTTTANATV